MSSVKKNKQTLDQKFNYVVSLAEAIIDAPDVAMQKMLLASLSAESAPLLAELDEFLRCQVECPDYAIVGYCHPKFLLERLRLLSKCVDRSHGLPTDVTNARRRVSFDVDVADGPVAELLEVIRRVEEKVWKIKTALSRPSPTAFDALYGRLDMAANVQEHLHDSVLEDINDWRLSCHRGRPSAEQLSARRREVVESLRESAMAGLAEVAMESYETREEFRNAVARNWYASLRSGAQTTISAYMEQVYRLEEYADWGFVPEEAPAAESTAEPAIDGIAEILDYVDAHSEIMEEGYTTIHFRQVINTCLRNEECREYLGSRSVTMYKDLNLASFDGMLGLMMANGLFATGPTQLAKYFFEGDAPTSGLQTVGTARVHISNGQQFDKPQQEEVRYTIESAIKIVKRSREEELRE